MISVALAVYDTILTLQREVQYVWRQRWGGATVIYFVNRYVYITVPFLNELLTSSMETETVSSPSNGSPIR